MGGAEFSLLQHVTHASHVSSVLLFEDGPLAARLAQAGIGVEVARVSAGPIRVRRESGWVAALKSAPAVLALVGVVARRARGYDIVYANSQKAFVVSALSMVLARRKLVWHLHDILTAAHFGGFLRWAAVLLANWRADWVIANSEATASAFAGLGGRRKRLAVVHQGIDEAPFAAVPEATVAALRAELGAESGPLIGVFGRLAAWKGQAIFLEALAKVPGAIGVIVGEALFGEQAYAETLHHQVARLGLQDRVRFLGFRADVPALMRAMDIVMHSSIAPEPFGRVVVEGMMAGRPVIASAAGGVLEIVNDGVTGFLYEPGNATALAALLKKVLNSPELAARVAQTGQAHARLNFSAASHICRVEEILALVSSDGH